MYPFWAVVGKQWGYVQAATSIDDRLAMFQTRDDAFENIREHQKDLREAGMDCDLDWTPEKVRNASEARAICSRSGTGMPIE